MGELNYDASLEVNGILEKGHLKLNDKAIIFKNGKSGKTEEIQSGDMEIVNWLRFAGGYGIRVFTTEGKLYRFGGFKESDFEKLSKHMDINYKKLLKEKELSVKGWNWGTAQFKGNSLMFEVSNKPAFEIPLNHVSKGHPGKNEVTLEFHQNDDAPVCLMEMRFHIPPGDPDTDPVESFHEQVMKKASVITSMGDAIAIFREIQCLTPRGRYDIKIFTSFVQLHGKTFDFKIPMKTVLRLFLLPHRDQRQMFFVLSLDPPIKQGQTRYHYLILLFPLEEEISIDVPLTDEEIAEKYGGRLEKELTGPTYEVISKLMKAMVNRKITVPGNFIGNSGTPAIGCSYKAAAGYLYPLERGFIYVHKPPIHVRFEEISTVNFARSGASTRSFDFEVELKSGPVYTFSSIEKEEYPKLYEFFISQKKLRMKKATSKDDMGYMGGMADSDNEEMPDAYLERVKAEGKEKDVDSESTDEDFNPGEEQSDVAEEFDSNVSSSDSDLSGSDAERKKRKKAASKPRKPREPSDKPKKKRQKTIKDANKPKRPPTAYMLWFNESRESLKAQNPGLSLPELSKKAGEVWRSMGAEAKRSYDERVLQKKKEYEEAMKEYKESGAEAEFQAMKKAGSAPVKSSAPRPKKPSVPKSSPVKGGFKSKEYISDDDSSGDDDPKVTIKDKVASDDDDDDEDDDLQLPDSEDEDSDSGSDSD